MAQKKASLACADCGNRNYSISVSSTPKPTRLEVNKFCKIVKNIPCIKKQDRRHRETNRKYFQSLERHDLARA